MGTHRSDFFSLLDNEKAGAFMAYNADFMGFRAQILNKNLFTHHAPNIKKCVFMEQMHSNKVELFNESKSVYTCDGLITDQKNIALCVLSADCLPLLLWHEKGYIGALHSGRKGCFSNILNEAIQKMRASFDTNLDLAQMHLFIGASICKQNYEINGEVLAEAMAHFKDFVDENKLDLKALVKAQAKKLHIAHIHDSRICNFEDKRFFSYRRDKSEQRFVSVIYLK
ncbi:polyphenol oxidase family protein [Campylobacter sp. MIT 97-5078]|uniref:polyphenol oxidase family protein n=1 Tax=Campylobacter sp. MIT 97-5078 TaxID=1548153 RepID=UPI000513E498|nr:polyphenol oxidase family protein [Campylobacter sp. MIT 97-5078]KGI56353.1 laccase [Campylobacter sp. MIT 97-5078]KGI56857.1 laccase [Campylobacter sp. MIT 97-5078]KGI56932.1 laccase [Campylobacter sp. MIT 97-5078]TQR26691.1 laccase [Campylobacter sp. MIT 97-5078]